MVVVKKERESERLEREGYPIREVFKAIQKEYEEDLEVGLIEPIEDQDLISELLDS